MAFRAFWNTLISDPETGVNLSQSDRLYGYREAYAYYTRAMFSNRNGADWTSYLSDRELYKHTRLIFNPVPNIVDFYVDNLWKAEDNKEHPALALPVADGAKDDLLEGIAQLDQWGRWLSEKSRIVKYTASMGNVLIEGIDDLVRQKVYHETVYAGFIKEVELNASGDVQAYVKEHEVYDKQNKRTYLFRKEVNREDFRYFRDGSPFTPQGKTAEVEANPYGFCFAVWLKHGDNGGDYGTGAINDFNKIDEVNSLASHLHDNIHKEIESGKIIGVEETESLKMLTGGSQNADGSINETDPRMDRVLLLAKGNVSVADLSGLLKLSEAHPYLKELILSIGGDYPELEYKQILKESAQMSGIALERLLTPAQNRLDGAQSYYNEQIVKLRQMQLAVGGMRANGGGWTMRTKQQAVFRPFNLNSYQAGNLDFQLKPSVLISLNEKENEEILTLKAQRASTLKDIVDEKELLLIAGYSEKEADDILTRKEQAAARRQIEAGQPVAVAGVPALQLSNGLGMEK
jgi:hypothetical protein